MIITCLTDCLVWGYKNFSLKSRKAKITGERKQQQKRTFIITDYSYRESEGENGSWILRRKSENKRKDPRRWLQSRPDWEVGNLQWEKLFYFFPDWPTYVISPLILIQINIWITASMPCLCPNIVRGIKQSFQGTGAGEAQLPQLILV